MSEQLLEKDTQTEEALSREEALRAAEIFAEGLKNLKELALSPSIGLLPDVRNRLATSMDESIQVSMQQMDEIIPPVESEAAKAFPLDMNKPKEIVYNPDSEAHQAFR